MKKIKITAVSDTHKDYRKLKLTSGDIFIHAGDIDCYRYDVELVDFNKWLGKLDFKYKIVIGGNHDGYLENLGINTIQEKLTNGIYLENSSVTIEGIKFYGSPITPRFLNWSFMANRGEDIDRYWDCIPEDTDVLITHGPPYGILDRTLNANGTIGDIVGCFELRKRINEIKPKYHIFGHIHFDYGTLKYDNTTFYNVSVMNEQYELVNKPTEFIYEL